MILQKKSNNFYNKNEKKVLKLNKDKEQNNFDDKNYKKYSKYQFTEAKTYNKNKILRTLINYIFMNQVTKHILLKVI
jgi:hypothetical protein